MVRRKDSRSKDSQNSLTRAKDYSFRLLRYRARSEDEMRERLLRKGFNKDVVDCVMNGLKERGLIDDREAAQSFLRMAISKNLGKMGVKEYLLKRRIPYEIVDDLVDMVDEKTSIEILLRKYLTRKGLKKMDMNNLNLLRNYLLRRGYGIDTIMNVLKNIDHIMEEL